LFVPKTYLARTIPQVHDHVELEVKRNGGNCDHKEAGFSRQEMRNRTGVLCETEPEVNYNAMSCGTLPALR
jgi:hypothetical protein